jgi:hypothetical protein
MTTTIEFTEFDVWFIGAVLIYLLISSAVAHIRCGVLGEKLYAMGKLVDELEKRK